MTTREWVTFGIAIVAIVALLIRTRRSARKSRQGGLRALTAWKVLVVLAIWLIWIVACVVGGWLLGWWNWSLFGDTLVLVVTLALPALFRLNDQRTGRAIVRGILAGCLGVVALVTFYVNLASFPLPLEIVFQLLLVSFFWLQAEAAKNNGRRGIQTVSSVAVFGLVVAAGAWTTVELMASIGTIDFSDIARSFGLTLWLPIALIPLLYLGGFLMGAESALWRVSTKVDDVWHLPPPRISVAIVLGLRFSVKLAHRLTWTEREVVAPTVGETLGRMKWFRESVREADRRTGARQRALRHNVGTQGTDEEGAQLDRREFEATKRALDWIAAIEQSDHGRGGNFWTTRADELLNIQGFGLQPPFGVVVETTADRKKWRAWRRTPSGWILGRAGDPDARQWYYSGSVAPFGWPDDPEWIERPDPAEDITAPPDWAETDGTDDL